jgi:NAD(P)H-hydrate repair Nnr-like enzyme with NAD(P)H-hydrate dehydratase domain
LKDFGLLVKGKYDLVLTNKRSYIVRTEGGNKRSGGIGDIVAGTAAVCSFWDLEYGLVLAARIVKMATKLAFEAEGRGLTAPNVIREIPQTVMRIEGSNL